MKDLDAHGNSTESSNGWPWGPVAAGFPFRMRRKAVIDASLGARIRARRKVIGMTQAELADAIDVSFQQLQKYEKGHNAISSERLALICEAMKLPADYFAHSSTTGLMGVAALDALAPRERSGNTVAEFVASAEGRRLVTSFMSIDDRMLRTRILDFIASLTSTQPR